MGETNFIDGVVERIENGQAVVSTAMGPIVGGMNGPLPEGKEVTLSIRPEAIRIGASAHTTRGDANTFDGGIHDTIYLGEVAQHLVRVAGVTPVELRAFELNPRVVARDGAIENAPIWIDPADVVVLPREEAS
jgi:ABC-type Fe3+/spermidine/putrescine transport system ATPase subunit